MDAQERRGGADPRMPLSRDRVLRVVLRFADEAGLDAVTMRAVGQRLHVEAMFLDKHVNHKGDIVDDLVEIVVSEILCLRR
ncbi:hypothetical protein [Sorangium sp. So ce426]|uniref:hypothetical protein n=1 Tax=unclassified Sorangium TaxID=2621164 RepID=UPI003F5CAA6A